MPNQRPKAFQDPQYRSQLIPIYSFSIHLDEDQCSEAANFTTEIPTNGTETSVVTEESLITSGTRVIIIERKLEFELAVQ